MAALGTPNVTVTPVRSKTWATESTARIVAIVPPPCAYRNSLQAFHGRHGPTRSYRFRCAAAATRTEARPSEARRPGKPQAGVSKPKSNAGPCCTSSCRSPIGQIGVQGNREQLILSITLNFGQVFVRGVASIYVGCFHPTFMLGTCRLKFRSNLVTVLQGRLMVGHV